MQHYSGQITGVHPCCEAVPQMGRRDFDNLVDEIGKHGMLNSLLIDNEGLLLDGRNRLLACYLLRLQISGDQIEVTDAPPGAIANSNIARRHLTVDQRVMIAVDTVKLEREAAAERKRTGQKKGRENRNSQLGAKCASNQSAKARTPRTLEKVAKETGTSRVDLALAEKVAKVAPALANAVKAGKLPLADAASKAGVAMKHERQANTGKRKSTSNEPNKNAVKPGSRQNTKYSDLLTTIVDRRDGIRVVAIGNVSIFHHQDLTSPLVIVDDDQGKWWVRNLAEGLRSKAESKEEATRRAIAKLKTQLKRVSADT